MPHLIKGKKYCGRRSRLALERLFVFGSNELFTIHSATGYSNVDALGTGMVAGTGATSSTKLALQNVHGALLLQMFLGQLTISYLHS
jgi:hypothetical protein